MKRLGVIGGLGPMATAYFMELIIQMTDAKIDQEHLEMIIYNIPSIPDRTSFILGKSKKNPLNFIINIGKELERENVNYIAVPCITAHYFYRELEKNISVPIIHIIREIVLTLKQNNIQKVGIIATDGTITSELFQKELENFQIEWCIPDKRNQAFVMELIYQDIKSNHPINREKFDEVSKNLQALGAEVIILGCTELSLIKKEQKIGIEFLDAMEVLARKAVLLCEAPLKEEYQCLVKKRKI